MIRIVLNNMDILCDFILVIGISFLRFRMIGVIVNVYFVIGVII